MPLFDGEPIYQVMVNFMNSEAHLRLVVAGVGASTALCGVTIAGYFRQKFQSISQLSGKRGCGDCRRKYMEELDER